MPPPSRPPLPTATVVPSRTCISRLNKDFSKLMNEPIEGIFVAMKPNNILEWHYVLLGSPDTPYVGGVYHGRLLFQPDFPWKPPSIYMDTPSGRFVVGQRLCLSISDYHPESWNPGWSVGSILSFMNEEDRAVGTITPSPSRTAREDFAIKSLSYNKKNRDFCELFPELLELSDELQPQASTRKGPKPQSTNAAPEVSKSSSARRQSLRAPPAKVRKRAVNLRARDIIQLD